MLGVLIVELAVNGFLHLISLGVGIGIDHGLEPHYSFELVLLDRWLHRVALSASLEVLGVSLLGDKPEIDLGLEGLDQLVLGGDLGKNRLIDQLLGFTGLTLHLKLLLYCLGLLPLLLLLVLLSRLCWLGLRLLFCGLLVFGVSLLLGRLWELVIGALEYYLQ